MYQRMTSFTVNFRNKCIKHIRVLRDIGISWDIKKFGYVIVDPQSEPKKTHPIPFRTNIPNQIVENMSIMKENFTSFPNNNRNKIYIDTVKEESKLLFSSIENI